MPAMASGAARGGRATVAETIADVLAAHGVKRIFGVPGGGSNLEIIDACAARGVAFVLAHTETGAAIMAAATGELGGAPGVVVTGLGPGAAAAANGLAYAALDRAPVLAITDSYRPGDHDRITHQRIDHAALFAPLVKASGRAAADNCGALVARLLRAAAAPPGGPVHCDLSAIDAAMPAAAGAAPSAAALGAEDTAAEGDINAARAQLAAARRPVLIAGVQARGDDAAEALAALAEALACPVMTTYKGKGVYPHGGARHAGLFTGGAAEAPWLRECDLLILYGVDPVELVASPWPYAMPVMEIARAAVRPHYTDIAVSLTGGLAGLARALAPAARPANRSVEPRPAPLPETAPPETANGALSPLAPVRAAIAAMPDARITVDAGAHMLAPMSLWPAKRPFDAQISNGLSTMGFALPAAIATALAEPGRRVVAFTGDGGLAMCLGELATAARHALPIVVVVFNDARLALIDAKQEQRGFAPRGMRFPALDFAAAAEGLGCRAARAADADELEAAFAAAAAVHSGPTVIDAAVDSSGYRAMFEAIRGAPAAAART